MDLNPQFRPLKLNQPFQFNLAQPMEQPEPVVPPIEVPNTAPTPAAPAAPNSGYQWKTIPALYAARDHLTNPGKRHTLMTDATNALKGSWNATKAVAKDTGHALGAAWDAAKENVLKPTSNYVLGTDYKPAPATPAAPATAPATPANPAAPAAAPYVPGDLSKNPLPDPSKVQPISTQMGAADFANGGMLPKDVKRENNGTYTRSVFDDKGQYKGWVNGKTLANVTPENPTISTAKPEEPLVPTQFGGLKANIYNDSREYAKAKAASQAGQGGYTTASTGGHYR